MGCNGERFRGLHGAIRERRGCAAGEGPGGAGGEGRGAGRGAQGPCSPPDPARMRRKTHRVPALRRAAPPIPLAALLVTAPRQLAFHWLAVTPRPRWAAGQGLFLKGPERTRDAEGVARAEGDDANCALLIARSPLHGADCAAAGASPAAHVALCSAGCILHSAWGAVKVEQPIFPPLSLGQSNSPSCTCLWDGLLCPTEQGRAAPQTPKLQAAMSCGVPMFPISSHQPHDIPDPRWG